MELVPFYIRFPDLAAKETRSIFIFKRGDLPPGQYGFLELFCDDPKCDCRRVVISVISPQRGTAPLATINYGWERVEFYARWLGTWKDAAECKGPSLDPLNPQTEYSEALLALFASALEDEQYRERLERHYALFKSTLPRARKARTSARGRVKKKRRLRK
jgi:hypothetical protein